MDFIKPRALNETNKSEDATVEPKALDEAQQRGSDQNATLSDGEGDQEVDAINLNTFVRKVSSDTVREIDDLMSKLQAMREKLLGEGTRVEGGISDYMTLNQSVAQLTKIVFDGVSRMTAPRSSQRSGR